MTVEESSKILEHHNKWRLGEEDLEMLPPSQISKAIDVAIEAMKSMNCLAYNLRFCEQNLNYKILYNSFHCISVPKEIDVKGFLPIESFGYNYFYNWHEKFNIISNEDIKLLNNYFKRIN